MEEPFTGLLWLNTQHVSDRTRHGVMRKSTQALLGQESDFCPQQRVQAGLREEEKEYQEMTSAEGTGDGFHCVTLSGVEAARPTALAWSYCHTVMKRWRLSLTLRL